MNQALSSTDQIQKGLQDLGYIADRSLATTLYLADQLQKPILVEGPAGVGKTELAKAIASLLGTDLLRLQCYEGLDEAKTLYEWEYPKQLLYTQILRDKVGELLTSAGSLREAVEQLATEDNAFFSERFLLARPILQALQSEKRVVLLIDEVDRAEAELEAFFLEILGEFQVSIPELGTITATHRPFVVLTSNNTREISDALRRRCLYLWLDYPTPEREAEIIRSRVPKATDALAREVVRVVQKLRDLDLKKKPSISETIDWTRALVTLNIDTLEPDLVRDTLNLLLKYQGDVQTAQEAVPALLATSQDRGN